MAKWRVKVQATETGFHDKTLRYPEGSDHPMRGQPFVLGPSIWRRDREDRVLVDKDNRPLLPTWVKALEPVPPIDPKQVPCVKGEVKGRAAYRQRRAQLAAIEDDDDRDEIPVVVPAKRGRGEREVI